MDQDRLPGGYFSVRRDERRRARAETSEEMELLPILRVRRSRRSFRVGCGSSHRQWRSHAETCIIEDGASPGAALCGTDFRHNPVAERSDSGTTAKLCSCGAGAASAQPRKKLLEWDHAAFGRPCCVATSQDAHSESRSVIQQAQKTSVSAGLIRSNSTTNRVSAHVDKACLLCT